jgi:hypothetical protein
MKLLKATYKKDDDWYGLKIGLEEGEIEGENQEEIWMTTIERVVNYAKNQIEEGSEVKVDYDWDENDGYFANRITKVGRSSSRGKGRGKSTRGRGSKKTSKYACEDCGKELKDGKYKKCYECNQKNPSPKFTSDDGERRNKLSVLSTAAQAVAINQQARTTDIDTLIEQIKTVYDHLYKHIFGE